MDITAATKFLSEKVNPYLAGCVEARRPRESLWEECAWRLYGRMGGFSASGQSEWSGRHRGVNSAVPQEAIGRFVALLTTGLIPGNERWHKVRFTQIPSKYEPVILRQWMEDVTAVLFGQRQHPESHFDNSMWNVFMSMALLGTGVLFVERGKAKTPMAHYRFVPLRDIFLKGDSNGDVRSVIRRSWYSRADLIREFPERGPSYRGYSNEMDAHEKIEVFHVVAHKSNLEYMKASEAERKEPISEYYFIGGDGGSPDVFLLRQGGYSTMPYMVGRIQRLGGEVYGTGIAETIIGDLRQYDELSNVIAQSVMQRALPPIVLDPSVFNGGKFSTRLGATNVTRFPQGGNLPMAVVPGGEQPAQAQLLLDKMESNIRDAFHNSPFQSSDLTGTRSATEVALRAQKYLIPLKAWVSVISSEILGPMFQREYALAEDKELLPLIEEISDDLMSELIESGMPESMVANLQSEADLEPVFTGHMAQAGNGGVSESVLQFISIVAQLSQQGLPQLAEVVDVWQALKELAEHMGVPASTLLPKETYDRLVAERKELEQQALQSQIASNEAKFENAEAGKMNAESNMQEKVGGAKVNA